MLFILIAALLATASAFAPLSSRHVSSTLKMGFEKEIGAQPPLGFWDPLGLLKNADQERFDTLRRYETKHGRVAMLAIVGHIVTTAGYRVGGDVDFGVPFSSVKAGLAALETIPQASLWQIIGFIGLLELGFGYQEKNIADECKARMKEWGWSEETQRRKYAVELNNGRAAQMGILGLIVHEKLNNDPYILNHILGFPVPFNQ
eukprot:gene233-251_t